MCPRPSTWLPLLASLSAAPAVAGGYMYADSGVAAMGQAGAFVASADDLFAQHYNPAGLIHLDRQQVDIGISGVNQGLTFTRRNEDGTSAEPTKNLGKVFVIPQVAWGARVHRNVSVAFGLYTPYAPDYRFDPNGPGRYVLKDSVVRQGSIGPSVAWRPTPAVTIGVGLQAQFLEVGQSLDVTTRGTENPDTDIGIDILTRDLVSPSANIGVLLDPVDALTVGLAVQLPSRFDATGHMTADFTGNSLESLLADPIITDDAVTLRLDLPLQLRAGVALHPSDDAVIELAAVYQGWSSLKALTLRDIDLTVDAGFGAPIEVANTLDLPTGFQDTVSVRLGGSARVADPITLRAGVAYETGSQKNQRVSVSLYDPAKVQISAGATAHLANDALQVHLSGSYLHFASKDIRGSVVRQVNVQDGDTLVMGNGVYTSSGFVLGAAVSARFGRSFDD